MKIDGPKTGYFLSIWVKVCLKSWIFLTFSASIIGWFLDKMLALSNKESAFVLVSGFFSCCCIFIILSKYY